ncbi:hypothetical protein ACFQU2_11205 [Siccirubricoccus deserti]
MPVSRCPFRGAAGGIKHAKAVGVAGSAPRRWFRLARRRQWRLRGAVRRGARGAAAGVAPRLAVTKLARGGGGASAAGGGDGRVTPCVGAVPCARAGPAASSSVPQASTG